MLTSSTGINYGLNEHEDFDLWLIYNTIQDSAILKPPASLVDLLDKLIELWWWEQTDGHTQVVGTDKRTDAGDDNNPSAEEAEG